MFSDYCFFFSNRRRHTRCALVTGVQTCALPISLMEKGVTFGSNELTILPPQNENYCPQYVRLRLRSEAAAKHRPVSSFTGQSSVDSEGFDPLVVPTLVDHETGRILAD